jgi:hypothetical protein
LAYNFDSKSAKVVGSYFLAFSIASHCAAVPRMSDIPRATHLDCTSGSGSVTSNPMVFKYNLIYNIHASYYFSLPLKLGGSPNLGVNPLNTLIDKSTAEEELVKSVLMPD